MESSNYEEFIGFLQPLEKLCLSVITGIVLCKEIQKCEDAGLPLSSTDLNQVSLETAMRYRLAHGELYVRALCDWALHGHTGQKAENDDAAADDGGCDAVYNNST